MLLLLINQNFTSSDSPQQFSLVKPTLQLRTRDKALSMSTLTLRVFSLRSLAANSKANNMSFSCFFINRTAWNFARFKRACVTFAACRHPPNLLSETSFIFYFSCFFVPCQRNAHDTIPAYLTEFSRPEKLPFVKKKKAMPAVSVAVNLII